MARRRYLVTYDISDDKRRTRVFKICFAIGDHTQYSVFVCDLSERERIQLEAQLTEFVHHLEDQILFVDLGPAELEHGRVITALGMKYEPPVRAVVI